MASTSRMLARNLLPSPSPLLAPFDEPADVDDLDGGVDDVAAPRHRGQAVEALVGDLGDADVGVLGGERVRRGERAAAGECVVQRALAGVGEADEAEAFHAADDVLPSPHPGPSVETASIAAVHTAARAVGARARAAVAQVKAHRSGPPGRAARRARASSTDGQVDRPAPTSTPGTARPFAGTTPGAGAGTGCAPCGTRSRAAASGVSQTDRLMIFSGSSLGARRSSTTGRSPRP